MDDDRRELLERRLAERVESRVRPRIFGFYAALGSIVLAVVGFFGYNVVTGLEQSARDYAERAVAPSVEQARVAALEAGAQAQRIAAKLEALEEFQGRREAALLQGEQQVQRNQTRVNQLAAEIEHRLEEILARLNETQQQVQATQATLQDAESELAAQQSRLRDETAGIGNVAQLAASLAALSEEVALLQEQLREVRERTGGGRGYETPLADAGRIETIQRVATAQAQAGLGTAGDGGGVGGGFGGGGGDAGVANTVYFQFAGVPREVAEGISARLRPLGFEVPGEERIATAAGLREVRYFFAEDRDRAEALADAVDAIMREDGYRAGVRARDLTGYAAKKPRPGTLELWLEPVPTG